MYIMETQYMSDTFLWTEYISVNKQAQEKKPSCPF